MKKKLFIILRAIASPFWFLILVGYSTWLSLRETWDFIKGK